MSRLGRAVMTFTAAVLVFWVGFVAAFMWLPAIGSPSEDALQYSLSRRAGGGVLMATIYGCERRAPELQICEVPDANGSGSATYRVRLDGRCWDAHKISPNHREEGPPFLARRVSGCVEFRDQVRLFDRI
jgi:hypothetical protein